ncbi:hypothetical protein BKA64DRAFT_45338 [Cadophora sp. MPI-SDFR-AT-0126]|nr:hypothetical protein BKA64DRAFT_45338 [Leotiomycetes sp. MPI-SDFR-AT-0126]
MLWAKSFSHGGLSHDYALTSKHNSPSNDRCQSSIGQDPFIKSLSFSEGIELVDKCPRVPGTNAQPAQPTSRPFICDIRGCSHTYKRIHELRRHKRTHLGVKPHACQYPLCNRSGRNGFVRKDHLKQHMRQVHHHV